MVEEQNIQPKQTDYLNEWHELRINLLLSANWLRYEIKDLLEPFGLTIKQFNVLRILRGHKGDTDLSILEIKNKMIDKMSDTSRIIDRLCKKNLICKNACSMDKRSNRVEITKEGLNLLDQIEPVIDDFDKVVQGLSSEEAKQLSGLLRKLRGVV
ncbi:MAG: MarR family transcriptional regulator [Bacteroidota bacterium]